MNTATARNITSDVDLEILKEDKLEQTLNMLVENLDLGEVRPEELELIIQNGYEAGEHFTIFLRTIGQSIVARRASRTIKINRKKLFDPVQFMHHRGLEIEEQDERSVMLEEIDSATISLESMLQGEKVIRGEEHLNRLKQKGHIRLDAGVFQTLWENQHLIPEHWQGTKDNPKNIFFDGTVFRNQYGRYVISMYRDVDQKWSWTYCRLDIGGWKAEDLSAVIKRAEPLRRVDRRRPLQQSLRLSYELVG
jgi:hypothetical protein